MRFIDKAVWVEKKKILVLADLHLGFEEGLQEQGVILPRFQYKEIIKDLDKIFSEIGEIREAVILGDLKHEFGRISKEEWTEVLDFLSYLSKKVKKIVLIKGNHDTILEPIAKKKGIKIRDFYIKEGLAFLHGHKLYTEVLDRKVREIFLGHMHPAISISRGAKREIYKCFLKGMWKGKKVVILPSFFPLVEGADIVVEKTNLDSSLDLRLRNFEVYVPVSAGEVLELGKVKKVGKLVG